MMAVRAGNGVVAAKNRIEVEQFAKFDLGRGERIFFQRFHSWKRLLQSGRALLALAPGLIRLIGPVVKSVAGNGFGACRSVTCQRRRTKNRRDGKDGRRNKAHPTRSTNGGHAADTRPGSHDSSIIRPRRGVKKAIGGMVSPCSPVRTAKRGT